MFAASSPIFPFLSALVTHPDVRANAIDTGFIERELKNLTPPPPSPGDLELCAAVDGDPAFRNSPTLAPRRIRRGCTSGWMPVGRRQRVFTFRHGQGAEQEIRLHYGNGPGKMVDRRARIGFVHSPPRPMAGSI